MKPNITGKSVLANCFILAAEKWGVVHVKAGGGTALPLEIIWLSKLKMSCVCHMWLVEQRSLPLPLQIQPKSVQPRFLFPVDSLSTGIAPAAGLGLVPPISELISFFLCVSSSRSLKVLERQMPCFLFTDTPKLEMRIFPVWM